MVIDYYSIVGADDDVFDVDFVDDDFVVVVDFVEKVVATVVVAVVGVVVFVVAVAIVVADGGMFAIVGVVAELLMRAK